MSNHGPLESQDEVAAKVFRLELGSGLGLG